MESSHKEPRGRQPREGWEATSLVPAVDIYSRVIDGPVGNTSWQALVTLCLTFSTVVSFPMFSMFSYFNKNSEAVCIYILSINLKLDTFDSGVIYSFVCV